MPEGHLILIVDDDESDLRAMQMTLEAEGYNVRACLDGRDALAEAQRERPDLIIIDLIMPPPDGFEVCRELNENEELKNIPTIAVTAMREKMHKSAASADVRLRLDANAYIEKPIDPESLATCVKEILATP